MKYLPHRKGRSSSEACVNVAASASFQLLTSQLFIMWLQSSETIAEMSDVTYPSDFSRYLCCVLASKSGPPKQEMI